MKNGWKKMLAGILTGLLLCTLSTPVFAREVPDLTRVGSISVNMQYEGKAVPGGSLTMYQVGEAQEKDGNYTFVCQGEFAECGYSLEQVESQTLVKQLADYAAKKKIRGTEAAITEHGTVTFQGLKPGLYLFIQTKAADGYEKAPSFLVSVPMEEDGAYVYDVDASPKLELTKKTPSAKPEKPSAAPPASPSGARLPQTGQLNWPVPVLAAAGLLLFAAGWVLKYGKRKKHHAV